jgi:hypothetical protein
MKSKKGIATNDASNTNLQNGLTMTKYKLKTNNFQYECSFCLCELPDDGLRFDGIGACPLHFSLAERLINGLRKHRANYFLNLGVRR